MFPSCVLLHLDLLVVVRVRVCCEGGTCRVALLGTLTPLSSASHSQGRFGETMKIDRDKGVCALSGPGGERPADGVRKGIGGEADCHV